MKRIKDQDLSLDQAMATMDESEKERMRTVLRGILRIRNRTKFKNGSLVKKDYKHPLMAYAKLIEVCKTSDIDVAMKILRCAAAGQGTGNDDFDLELVLSQMEDLKPETPLEAVLISQMIAVNDAITRTMDVACDPSNAFGVDHWMKITGRLQRTFLLQVDALQKLRGKGQQTVRVEHVTVEAGGQAVIGNIEHHQGKQGGGYDSIRELPHVQSPPLTTLWSKDEERELVPTTGYGREKALSASRREE